MDCIDEPSRAELTSLGDITLAPGREANHDHADARVFGHDAEAINPRSHLCWALAVATTNWRRRRAGWVTKTCSSLIESEERLRVKVVRSAVADRVSLSWGSLGGPEHGDGCDGWWAEGCSLPGATSPTATVRCGRGEKNWRYRSAWRDGRATGRKKAHFGCVQDAQQPGQAMPDQSL